MFHVRVVKVRTEPRVYLIGRIPSPGVEAGLTLSCQSLMNADGIYLLSFYALLLNLKLCKCNFYQRRALPPALGLVSVFLHRSSSTSS